MPPLLRLPRLRSAAGLGALLVALSAAAAPAADSAAPALARIDVPAPVASFPLPVRAQLRVLVKRILRKYGYPPDKQEKATQTVLEQAEVLSEMWAAA